MNMAKRSYEEMKATEKEEQIKAWKHFAIKGLCGGLIYDCALSLNWLYAFVHGGGIYIEKWFLRGLKIETLCSYCKHILLNNSFQQMEF